MAELQQRRRSSRQPQLLVLVPLANEGGVVAPAGLESSTSQISRSGAVHVLLAAAVRSFFDGCARDSMNPMVGGSADLEGGNELRPGESLSPAMAGAGGGGVRGRRYLLEDVAVYLFPGFEAKHHAGDVLQSLVSASGKLQLLHKLLPKLKERGNRVLIFSQMKKMLDILENFLSFLGYEYTRIDGDTSLSERQESINEYNNNESETFIFLMSTRAGGLGIDLPGADRVVIYDPDFNPFMDLQAQSRAHRIGQTRPVVVYQLVTKSFVEEKILQRSRKKLALENILMNSSNKPPSPDELKSIILHGAKIIEDKKNIDAVSIQYDDEAIENLLDPSTGDMCTSDDNGYLGSILSFAHGVEEVVAPSPKVEDLKVFKPDTPKVDLGRGRRQRNVVKCFEDTENEESDDMYAPEASSELSSSSSDSETEQEAPAVASAKTEVDGKVEAASLVKPEVAPVPGRHLISSSDASSSSSDTRSVKPEVAPVPGSNLISCSDASRSSSDSSSSSSG